MRDSSSRYNVGNNVVAEGWIGDQAAARASGRVLHVQHRLDLKTDGHHLGIDSTATWHRPCLSRSPAGSRWSICGWWIQRCDRHSEARVPDGNRPSGRRSFTWTCRHPERPTVRRVPSEPIRANTHEPVLAAYLVLLRHPGGPAATSGLSPLMLCLLAAGRAIAAVCC